MLFEDRYKGAFSSRVGDRGWEYLEQGHVGLFRASGPRVEVDVKGGARQVYRVRIWIIDEHSRIDVDCTCPHAARGNHCKHVYAALLGLERFTTSFPVSGRHRLGVRFIDPAMRWDSSSFSSIEGENSAGEFGDLDHDIEDGLDSRFDTEDGSDADWRDQDDFSPPIGGRASFERDRRSPTPAPQTHWEDLFENMGQQSDAQLRGLDSLENSDPAAAPEIVYTIDIATSLRTGLLSIELKQRKLKRSGEWGKRVRLSLHAHQPLDEFAPDDRKLLGLLLALPAMERGSVASNPWRGTAYDRPGPRGSIGVPEAYFELLLPRLAATGRLGIHPKHLGRHTESSPPENSAPDDFIPLAWDGGATWQFAISVGRRNVGGEDDHESTDESGKAGGVFVEDAIALTGELIRDGESRPLDRAFALLPGGLVLFGDEIARFESGESLPWIRKFGEMTGLDVPIGEADALIERLLNTPGVPAVEGLEAFGWRYVEAEPNPVLHVEAPDSDPVHGGHGSMTAPGSIRFEYPVNGPDIEDSTSGAQPAQHDPICPAYSDAQSFIADQFSRSIVRRDFEAEARYGREVIELGARARPHSTETRFELTRYMRDGAIAEVEISAHRFADVIAALLERDWRVEADGMSWRRAQGTSMRVSTGIDWFELHGAVDFGDAGTAQLPEMLSALRRGDTTILLGDGSYGILPELWLERAAPLAQLGQREGDVLRFAPSQATLLDALLAARENEGDTVQTDAHFAKLRKRLHGRQRVEPRTPPRGFKGELRDYQRQGLGWLYFLLDLGLGGCLADDMGLGKTVQVLAMLEARRTRRLKAGEDRLPSLVVVPTSVVHNWILEAERFTPRLRVLDYRGKDRASLLDSFREHGLVVTSYGTLRRDITKLAEQRFDYAILDEAQAIKNSSSQIARAVRLLRAGNRLALTGTPVENHLGELFSIFEFLNPGLLGRNPNIQKMARSKKPEDETTLFALATALEPLILRRNKADVLSELPAKTEQTLYCDLKGEQRRLYDELRKHYRSALLSTVGEKGMAKSKIHVLEALLRLRQAACHPGLFDEEKLGQGSAKLDLLLEQLAEVIDEGHKVLVFSQFTKLLGIVRKRLDAAGTEYQYLDGRTRKREDKVQRFQNDPECHVFLISLKAGGVGLNLTAADYVFILDPWWNPAVEAQAIDRAHRIGQERSVFAYRIIARDTVEERILELQDRKRHLADAILEAEGGVLRELSLDDLRDLLA